MATIETRRSADGTIGYRAKVRLKGFPAESATFERKTDAKEWAKKKGIDYHPVLDERLLTLHMEPAISSGYTTPTTVRP